MIFTAHYPVYIGDTDAGGIVYHANHLNFLERCRRDWLKSLGFASYFLADGVHLVVKKADISYHRPLLLDELLTVSIEKVATKKQVSPSSSISTKMDKTAPPPPPSSCLPVWHSKMDGLAQPLCHLVLFMH